MNNKLCITIIKSRLQEGVDMGFEDDYGGNELDPKMWDSDND
jgi:hypothetical protein